MNWYVVINVLAWSIFGGILSVKIGWSWEFWILLVLVFVIHVTSAMSGSK